MIQSNFQKCRVYIIDNVYESNPPYKNCIIVCGFEKSPPLYNTMVYSGTYEDCLKFVEENCENCLNSDDKAYYFSQSESLKIQSDLAKYKGQKMKCETDKELELVVDISVQETAHKIVINNKVEYGHLVIITFEKHSGLVPAVFCSLNGLTPIYASHKELK